MGRESDYARLALFDALGEAVMKVWERDGVEPADGIRALHESTGVNKASIRRCLRGLEVSNALEPVLMRLAGPGFKPPNDMKYRACLSCGGTFLSTSYSNRMCGSCRTSPAEVEEPVIDWFGEGAGH